MPAAAIVGAAVVGAVASNSAAKKAAKAQQGAADAANATQLEMYYQSREDQAPWQQAGTQGLNALTNALGLVNEQNFDKGAYLAKYKDIANDPYWSLNPYKHYVTAGRGEGRTAKTTGETIGGMGLGVLNRSFGLSDFEKDPGYQFRLGEGQKALTNSAAARGGLLSGAAGKALARYNQDFASNEFGNAYNRFQTNQTNQFNRLASLAGVGQTAANQTANSAMQTGQIVGNNIVGAGNARASGYVGGANALTNAIGQGVNWYQQNQMVNSLNNSNQPWWNSADGINANGGGF